MVILRPVFASHLHRPSFASRPPFAGNINCGSVRPGFSRRRNRPFRRLSHVESRCRVLATTGPPVPAPDEEPSACDQRRRQPAPPARASHRSREEARRKEDRAVRPSPSHPPPLPTGEARHLSSPCSTAPRADSPRDAAVRAHAPSDLPYTGWSSPSSLHPTLIPQCTRLRQLWIHLERASASANNHPHSLMPSGAPVSPGPTA